MAFIQITDLHFVADDAALYGLSPAARLAPAIELINDEHRDAEFVLITGDLVDRGDEGAYRALRDALAPLIPPVHLMLGNHDSRGAFRQVFDGPDVDGFVQFVIEGREARIICLDTLIDEPGRADGALCDARLGWLANRVAETSAGRPWILALHHPPMEIGLPRMDRIMLPGGDFLWNALSFRPPAMMLLGHVHRPVHGTWRGIPFHIQRGVNHQVAYQPEQTEDLYFTAEPPEFSIVSVGAEGTLIHTRAYLSEGRAFPK